MNRMIALALLVACVLIGVPALCQETDIDNEDMVLMMTDTGTDMSTAQTTPMTGHAHEQMGPKHAPPMNHKMDKGRCGPGGMASFLNLTEDQMTKMRGLRSAYYRDTRDIRYDLMQKRLEMQRMFGDPKVDTATLAAKQKDLATLRQGLMDRTARLILDCRALLTPDQLQKIDLMMMAHGRMGCGMGHGGMMGGMGMMQMGGM